MNLVWKILLPLALLLPAVGYVAGTVASSGGSDLPPRETIVIDETAQDTTPARSTGTKGNDEPADGRKDDRSGSDRGTDDARPDDDDDDDIEVVEVQPDDYDDDGGNRGPGGGDDTRTGDDDSGGGDDDDD